MQIDSIKKTGRLILVQESVRTSGFAGCDSRNN
jgi:pyruvate/2-oxoglutarate/acetoin dehydrogenase E1 component